LKEFVSTAGGHRGTQADSFADVGKMRLDTIIHSLCSDSRVNHIGDSLLGDYTVQGSHQGLELQEIKGE